jgi:hypothetical protein
MLGALPTAGSPKKPAATAARMNVGEFFMVSTFTFFRLSSG